MWRGGVLRYIVSVVFVAFLSVLVTLLSNQINLLSDAQFPQNLLVEILGSLIELIFIVPPLFLIDRYYDKKEMIASYIDDLSFNKKHREAKPSYENKYIVEKLRQLGFLKIPFSGLSFDGCSFEDYVFSNDSFEETTFRGVIFLNCEFINCDFNRTVFDDHTLFSFGAIRKCDFSEAVGLDIDSCNGLSEVQIDKETKFNQSFFPHLVRKRAVTGG